MMWIELAQLQWWGLSCISDGYGSFFGDPIFPPAWELAAVMNHTYRATT